MKILLRLASVFVLVAVVVTIMSCGGHHPTPTPEPTQKEKVTAKLIAGNGTWTPAASGISVNQSGTITDVTQTLFKDFTIKFTATTITTAGTTPVWLRSDTWHFKDDAATVIVRGMDNKEITMTFVSDTQLKLSLQWDKTTTAPAGGRVESVPGIYEFTLNK
jgi:hypothetical protein